MIVLKEFKILEGLHYVTLMSPLKVFLDITNDCNLNCVFCYKPTEKIPADLTNILKILEELKKAEVVDVVMAGGEPFSVKDPIRIFNAANNLGLRVGIISNGTLITKEIVQKLPKNVDVTISFHAPNAEKYEKLTGSQYSFEKAVNGLKILNEAGIVPGILYTPTKYNKELLFDTVRFLINSKIQFACVQLNRLIPEGNACNFWSELHIDFNDYKDLLDQMLKVKAEWPSVRIETGDAVPFCAFDEKYHECFVRCDYGITVIAIDEHGNVKRCPCRRGTSGNVLETPLRKIWLESESLIAYRNLSTLPKICKNCHLLEVCGGGCLCTPIEEDEHVDTYIDANAIRAVETFQKPNTDYPKKEVNFLPSIPEMTTNYLIRDEKERFLCVPVGVQEVFLDSIIPRNSKYPVLWLNKAEKDILGLIDGERAICQINSEFSQIHQLNLNVAEKIVKETLESFIQYNYIK